MRLKRLIKLMQFKESERKRLTFGPGTRLNPQQHHLQLKQTGSGYPTTADLFVRTWSTTPRTMKRWIGFMATYTNSRNVANSVVTDVRFRLNNGGVQDLYWNPGAAAWVTAAPNNWNTEAEVAANIHLFPVSTQTLQVVINLRTTDPAYTPTVSAVRALYESDLEEMEDYVWRSLIPDMRSKILPIAEHSIEVATSGASIDLGDFPIETPYDLREIDSVYDLDADPNKLNNLFISYNDATKVISLSASIPAGNTALIRFLYRPVIAVTTNQDYTELEKVPEIVFERIERPTPLEQTSVDYVLNKVTGFGYKVPATQADIEINAIFVTDKAKDHARMQDAIKRYFADNQRVRSVGMDDDFDILMLGEPEQATVANQKDLHTGRFRFRIARALFFDNDAEEIHGVLNFSLAMTRATC